MCLEKKVLVVHGGLFSQDGVKLDDIRKIDRNQQPPDQGYMHVFIHRVLPQLRNPIFYL